MHETPADLERLQAVIDGSYARAGAHMLRIHEPGRRLGAAEVAARMTGMRLLTLATTTADGRPVTGPVDGIFHRGAFHFGSAPDSVRLRHIAQRPQVSATHLPGEELAIIVHGRARVLDMHDPVNAELRRTILGIYLPRYGAEWERDVMDSGALYVRIEPERMFTYAMPAPAAGGA